MKLVAIMPCRNEEWVIGLTARAVLMWADALVVLNHASTDGSAAILREIAKETARGLVWLHEPDPTWREMSHRQELLKCARDMGATHVAYVDADEILTGDLLPSIRPWCGTLPVGTMLSLPWLQLRTTASVMSSGMWAQQVASTVFRDSPELHWATRDGYDFHQRQPLGRAWNKFEPVGRHRRSSGLMHLQFLSERRLRAKHALYVAQELVRWPGRKPVADINEMYRRTVREAAAASVSPAPAAWWAPYGHLMPHLHIDAEPWQEQALRDLIAQHGREKFADAELFGVV
jgi:Glycosyl transferase family 2